MRDLSFIEKLFSSLEACVLCDAEKFAVCDTCLALLPRRESQLNFFSFFTYKDSRCQTLLRLAKYHHRYTIYRDMVHHIKPHILLPSHFTKETTLVIPVPMWYIRSWARGQNHAEHIARYLAKEMKLELEVNIVKKAKNTKRQALLSKKLRLSHQKDSFYIPHEKHRTLHEKNIILVDDIITTGATTQEVKRILLSGGANDVYIVALAH